MTVLPLALFLQDTATPSGPLAGPHSNALVDMVHNSGPTALTVLGILLIASIISWAIIIAKWRAFNEANVQSKRFLRAFRKSGRLSEIAAIADQFKPSPRSSPSSTRSTTSTSARPAAVAQPPIPRPSSAPPRPLPPNPSPSWNAA